MEKLTELQRAVQREMQRIITIIESKQKQGFSFIKLPSLEFDKTKARSKQLSRLKKYTPEKLMKEHSEWVNPETGEIYQKERITISFAIKYFKYTYSQRCSFYRQYR